LSSGTENGVLEGQVIRYQLEPFIDERGELLPFDFSKLLFNPKRVFFVTQVPKSVVRGQHGHRNGVQLLVCLAGKVEVDCYVTGKICRYVLEPRKFGLLIGAGVVTELRYQTPNSILMGMASTEYDPDEYFTKNAGL